MGYKLESRIPQIIAAATTGVKEANRASAERVAQSAKSRAPRDTGELANSIKTETGDGSDMLVGSSVWYGHFIEYGTSRQGARPFMTPAAEAERDAHRRAILRLFR